MKVFNEEKENNKGVGDSFILLMDKKEAATLIDMVEFAAESNKKKRNWKTIQKKLEDCLLIY